MRQWLAPALRESTPVSISNQIVLWEVQEEHSEFWKSNSNRHLRLLVSSFGSAGIDAVVGWH